MKEKILKHKKLSIFLVVLLVISIIAGIGVSRVKAAGEKMAEAMNQTQTAYIERRTLISSVSATGTVASSDSKDVAVNLSGVEVVNVFVEVGDQVEAGDVLCEFDAEDIEENLANAKASLNVSSTRTQMDISSAERSLAEAETTRNIELERADEDLADAWNDYMLALNDQEEAEDVWEEAKQTAAEKSSEYEYHQRLLAEAKQNLSNNTVSENSIKLQETITSLEKEVSSWQTKYNTAAQSETSAESAYEKAVSAAQSKLDAYNSKVRAKEDTQRNQDSSVQNKADSLTTSKLNATTSTQSDEQKVEQYEEQLEDCIVKAPISGIVTVVNVEAGDTYSGAAIVTIEDNSAYEVSAEIDEYDIGKIAKGQKVVIKTNGTSDEELEGTVQQIAPRATSGSSDVTYNVRISIDTPNDKLRLDMTAKLSIILESKENVLTVPYESVMEDESGNYYIEVVKRDDMDLSPPAEQGNWDENAGSQDMKDSESENAAVQTDQMPETKGERKIPESGTLPEGMEVPKGEEMSESISAQSRPADNRGNNSSDSEIETVRIIVEKGIESDYYIEVISDQIEEGMEVVVPRTEEDGMDIQGMMMRQGPMGGF